MLDQFARNMYRETSKAYQGDSLALSLSQTAIASGDDMKISKEQRMFLYMPFMHSESAKIHDISFTLFESLGNTGFEIKHKIIIDKFGRYPYINNALGRDSTPKEKDWLESHNVF